MPKVQLSMLGGFAAAVDGEPIPTTAWRLRKARELVKLLALAPGHRLHREQAMDVLWPAREPASAANNLHQAVHVARRTLAPDVIETRDELLHLHAEIDVDRFLEAAVEARRAATPGAARAALALYGGELLPENRYDDWADERREELAGLAQELEDEVAALGGAPTARPSGLPADASSFLGRDRELAELGVLLRGTRLLALAGTGGVGKTRLALELARAAEPGFADGAAIATLDQAADGRLVAAALAAVLDVRALAGQELDEALVEFLAPREMLLVLDNCEHVLPASAALADGLLRGAPGLTLVATSREPLRVPGEVVFRVPSLRIPDPEAGLEPEELEGFGAVRLFVERAASAAPGFALDPGNATDVARICHRLDGLPLALELAAGRLGALGPAAIAERLDDRFRVLRTQSHASPTRQHTLAATIQWSHDLLEPDERVLLRRLAVFAGGFSLEAAEEVCGGEDLDAAGLADVVARLVEKSLVSADEGVRERRYRLLETIRLYALERLAEAGEAEAVADRHAAWAIALAERERGSPRLDEDAANLRAAHDRLLAAAPAEALRLCVELWPFWMRRIDLREAERCLGGALAAAPARTGLRARALLAAAAIDYRSGALSSGAPSAEESFAVAEELGDVRAQWRALQFLGEFGIAADDAGAAVDWIERGLVLARREGLAAAEAVGVYSLGVARWQEGELATAEEHVAESIERLRALAGSPELITSPVNLTELRTAQPDGRPGLRLVFADTLQPFLEISIEVAIGYALVNRAWIARDRGDRDRARALLGEARECFARGGDDAGLAVVHVRRAHLDLGDGDPASARVEFEAALELRRGLGDRRGVGLALAGLGTADLAARDLDGADRRLAEALEIFRRAGDRWGLVSTLWRAADVALGRGDLDRARLLLEEARTTIVVTERRRWIAATLGALAEVELLRGDAERAAALLGEARERSLEQGDPVAVADAEDRLRELAKTLLSDRKPVRSTTPPNSTTKGSRA